MYHLRPATNADLPFLRRLHRATMREYIARTYGWDEAARTRIYNDEYRADPFQIVVVETKDVGAISVQQDDYMLFLAAIQVLPEHHRQGIGTAIITDLLAQCRAKGIPMMLNVLKVNPARFLYARLGFVVMGETPTHLLLSQCDDPHE